MYSVALAFSSDRAGDRGRAGMVSGVMNTALPVLALPQSRRGFCKIALGFFKTCIFEGVTEPSPQEPCVHSLRSAEFCGFEALLLLIVSDHVPFFNFTKNVGWFQ